MDIARAFDEVLDHVAGLDFRHLPPSAHDAARKVLFDTVGVIIGAHAQPIAQKLACYLDAGCESGVSITVCGFRRVSATAAAFANGAVSHDLELDDYHQTSALHAAAVFVPVALAIGEQTDASSEAVFLALIRAYEAACRLAFMLNPEKLYAAGFHPTTVVGVVGAAVVAASLLGLPRAQLGHACRHAMGLMSGIMACKTEPDHYTKSYQCGIAARNGVIAALSIANGRAYERTSADVLPAIAASYSGDMRPADGLAGLAQRFEIEHTGYKLYSCCRHIYPLLDALSKIRQGASVAPDDIRRITLDLYARGAINVGDHTLRTHNARYVVAMAVKHGAVRREFFTEQFGMESVRPLMDRIDLVADDALQAEWPEKTPGVVTLALHDGRVLSARVDHPKGGPENPATVAELRDKFVGLVTPVLGERRCARLADMLTAPSFRMRDAAAILEAQAEATA
jgi:2-methylcitrate dehydratase PrpD